MYETPPDLAYLLQETHAGRADHSEEILARIRSFPHIILHGAGLSGREILEFLEAQGGVKREKIVWWDYSYDRPTKVKGLPLFQPFTGGFPPDATLVIHCIHDVPPESQAVPEGYSRLNGILLKECFMCPLMLGEGGIQMTLCRKNRRCEAVRCPRLEGRTFTIDSEEQDGFLLNILTLVITQKCTLSCKHCNQYINHFPREEKTLFPARQIMEDIDRISAASDFIRVLPIIGGETFLHPDLPAIVRHALGKRNFGIVRLYTNGICHMSNEMLAILKHERCQLQFTDYTEQLGEKQVRLFRANVEKVAQAGIGFYVKKETWTVPPSMHLLGLSNELMRKMKAGCAGHQNCRMISNGVYYPCNFSMSLHQHHVSSDINDRVAIHECADSEDLRGKIAACDNQPFYESCRRCARGGKSIPQGEQGIDARYLHIGPMKKIRNESKGQSSSGMQERLS